jgi:hypothetical protein
MPLHAAEVLSHIWDLRKVPDCNHSLPLHILSNRKRKKNDYQLAT